MSIADKIGVSKLTKHFDLAVHRIHDEVRTLRCKLVHVPTKEQTADNFTKPLDGILILPRPLTADFEPFAIAY